MMNDHPSHPAMKGIVKQHPSLTPKARILSNYILKNPRKAVFMTTKELAETCCVSEATVVRFVSRLGYKGYGAFQQALRDFVDTELTLLERTDLSDMQGPGTDRLRRVVFEELANLKHFFETVDLNVLNHVVDFLEKSHSIYVIGSRLSYTFAYYLGYLPEIGRAKNARGPSRLLAYALDGKAKLPPARELPPMVKPPKRSKSEKIIAHGKDLFNMSSCWVCHGQHASTFGGTAPNLRRSPILQSKEAWYQVVVEGLKSNKGMLGQSHRSRSDSEAMRAFVIEKAWEEYQSQTTK